MGKRVAVVVSHPIQHFCPQYESWARIDGVDLRVFFASRHGLAPYHDHGFGAVIQWEGLSLDFACEFLEGADTRVVDGAVDCRALDARLSEWDAEIVVVYGYSQPLQRRATAWSVRNGRRVAMIGDAELRSRRRWLSLGVKRVWLGRHLRAIDVFLTVGDANEAYYRHYGVSDRRFVRTSFPIDRRSFDTRLPDRARVRVVLRGKLCIPADHVVVLMVGKLVPWKRQGDLVAFANRVGPSRGNVTVVLVGSGSSESILKVEVRRVGPGGVLFAGFVNVDQLVDYYLAADIYAHCAEIEPHSLAISEAIYSGLPVVLSDRCGSYGPTDDVRPGVNGYVYQCGDVEALSGSLLRLIDDRGLRSRMGAASTEIGRANQRLAHGKGLEQALALLGAA